MCTSNFTCTFYIKEFKKTLCPLWGKKRYLRLANIVHKAMRTKQIWTLSVIVKHILSNERQKHKLTWIHQSFSSGCQSGHSSCCGFQDWRTQTSRGIYFNPAVLSTCVLRCARSRALFWEAPVREHNGPDDSILVTNSLLTTELKLRGGNFPKEILYYYV